MKLAIHHRRNTFSTDWLSYCKEKNISYKLVNCYASDIIEQLQDCDALMWNWIYWHSRDVLFAKQLIYAIEAMGKKVFPDFRTSIFFDDKIGQKYLMESLKVPHINTQIFYYKEDAIEWIKKIKYPKVFKLRGGASSVNVKLVTDERQAKRLIRKAFNKGFASESRMSNLKDRVRKFNKNKGVNEFLHLLKGVIRLIYPSKHARSLPKERNYIYFQSFIPDNIFDIRVVVVGDKAVAMRRMVRKNDFRASGSGECSFSPSEIDKKYILKAFEINDKLKMQSVAFDFLSMNNKILLVEMSYNFVTKKWPGYWHRNGNFIDTPINVAYQIIENFIEQEL